MIPMKLPPEKGDTNYQMLGTISPLPSDLSEDSDSNETMVTVHSEDSNLHDDGFKTVTPKRSKRKRYTSFSPLKTVSTTPPSFLEEEHFIHILPTSPETMFQIKNIQTIRLELFKILKINFNLNINRDGSILISIQAGFENAKTTLLSLNSLGGIKVHSKQWIRPPPAQTKIVIYNIPNGIPETDLKDGLMNCKGQKISVSKVTRLGKPNNDGIYTSKSYLFTLDSTLENFSEPISLFGQIKPYKEYKAKPIQCEICLIMGHTKQHCKTNLKRCNLCQNIHPPNTANCANKKLSCINCKGPHSSDNRSVCPKYKARSMALRLSEKENIPFQFAKIKLMVHNADTPEFSEPNTQPNQKTLQQKATRTKPQKTFPGIKTLDFPPLPARDQDPESSISKPTKPTSSKLPKEISEENPNLLTNLCLYIFNFNSLSRTSLTEDQKSSILEEMANTYFPKNLKDTANTNFSTILNKLNLSING